MPPEIIGELHGGKVLIDRESRSVILAHPDLNPIKFSIDHPYIQGTKLEREARAALDTPSVPSASCATPLARRNEADAYVKILQTIARFPITDPKNMDAVNMRLIAEGAIAISSTSLGTARE